MFVAVSFQCSWLKTSATENENLAHIYADANDNDKALYSATDIM